MPGVSTAQPSAPAGEVEIWETRFLFFPIEVEVSREGGDFSGVGHLHGLFGGVTSYPFTGSEKDGRVVAVHDGHKFEGDFVSPDKVVGRVTLENGFRFRLKIKKRE
jgi:hypothetical protein